MNGYILTHSGQRVSEYEGAPTIHDVNLALGRIPRFAGHGRREWSVRDHSVLVHRLLRRSFGARATAQLRLQALLHDAHEAITSDVPSPLKPKRLAAAQHAIDARIREALAAPLTASEWEHGRQEVANFDRRALLAEALVVGPAAASTLEGVQQHFGGEPTLDEVMVLYDILNSPVREQMFLDDYAALCFSFLRGA